ncbi:hypothetical protein RUM43_012816 [Polyplax serrata]|uniref:Serine protease HTRA2, mitochondrial n=1 Tax=Polyplax serrata TaxID=468196 RepID=A0AAN8S9Q6_POLSC
MSWRRASKLFLFHSRHTCGIHVYFGLSSFRKCLENGVGFPGSFAKSIQDHERNGSPARKNCLLFTSLVTAGLFFYGLFREKWPFNFDPIAVVHAVDKNDNSFRKRFNFVANVVEQCEDAVVCIESQVYRFGGHAIIPRGSGFIVKEDGLILTNAHVVMDKPRSLQVKLKDGRIYPATIEDMDLEADLATIRINEKKLPAMKLGSSEDLRAGEWVIAIGNPYSLTHSVSAGVVSAPQRKGEDLGLGYKNIHYIQTDATTTFGNSGGPLVNLDGEVVGVNSMKVVTGISFAIPIEFVKKFLKSNEELRRGEGDPAVTLSKEKRGYLGIVMITLTSNLLSELRHKHSRLPDYLVNSVMICEIANNSPAYRGGLQPGDIISEINGRKTEGVRSIYDVLKSDISKPINLKIYRRDMFFNITLVPDTLQ